MPSMPPPIYRFTTMENALGKFLQHREYGFGIHPGNPVFGEDPHLKDLSNLKVDPKYLEMDTLSVSGIQLPQPWLHLLGGGPSAPAL